MSKLKGTFETLGCLVLSLLAPFVIAFAFGLLVLSVVFAGWWGGKPVPNARLEVEFEKPTSNEELFSQVQQLAHRAGHTRYEGVGWKAARTRTIERDHPPGRAQYHDYWARDGYLVGFGWDHVAPEVTSLKFRLVDEVWDYDKMDGFHVDDWVLFAEWRDRIRQEWPRARVSISRHPGASTRAELLAEASQASGIPLRDSDLKRVVEGDPEPEEDGITVVGFVWRLVTGPFR